MKKITPTTPRVIGRPDSLTDVLKQLLFQYEPRSLADLLPSAKVYLGVQQSGARLEKDVLRCLQKNPAFDETDQGMWSINLRGLRENDGAYQTLKKEAVPLRISEICDRLARNNKSPVPDEKRLVRDGRFLRLKGGQWILVPWEVIRAVQPKEMDAIADMLRRSGEPLPVVKLSDEILGTPWRETNLLQCMEEDQRFVWVGGSLWYLRSLIPQPVLPAREDPLAFLEEGETGALQGAELMLTFQDTDPNRRNYILSSRDLRLGVLRLNKRLEKIFVNLPSLAFISFKTPTGPSRAWYFREHHIIIGLGNWFESQNLSPGNKLEIRRVQEGDEISFHLVSTGEREAEVYAEAKRVERIAAMAQDESIAGWPLDRVVTAVLQVFPEGMGEEMLLRIVKYLRPEAGGGVLSVLADLPYLEEISPGTWYFNETMKRAYDELQNQVSEVKGLLERQKAEAAATVEHLRSLSNAKQDLEVELEALRAQNRDLKRQMEELLARYADLERENEDARANMEKIIKRKDMLRAELGQSEEETANLQAEKEALEIRVQQLETRVLQLQGSYNKSLGKSQSEHAALKERLNDTEKRLQGALVANQELQKLLAQLQEERLELRRRLRPWPVRTAVWFSRFLGFNRNMAVDT